MKRIRIALIFIITFIVFLAITLQDGWSTIYVIILGLPLSIITTQLMDFLSTYLHNNGYARSTYILLEQILRALTAAVQITLWAWLGGVISKRRNKLTKNITPP